mmetsp:Transcript_39185/g.110775  ORF Transcript_39185/g.110775 Transcript_39185/m.110775 type:complete len:98 (-) Transcript_39185:52-345(-)
MAGKVAARLAVFLLLVCRGVAVAQSSSAEMDGSQGDLMESLKSQLQAASRPLAAGLRDKVEAFVHSKDLFKKEAGEFGEDELRAISELQRMLTRNRS